METPPTIWLVMNDDDQFACSTEELAKALAVRLATDGMPQRSVYWEQKSDRNNLYDERDRFLHTVRPVKLDAPSSSPAPDPDR